MGDPTHFILQEVTGDERELVLGGRALPYQGLKLGGKQRAEFTWYPGNPVASVQMLGPEEMPTTINGIWKDRFIKTSSFLGFRAETPEAIALWNGQQVEDALALTQVCDQLRLAGQLIKMTWDEQVRHGILLRFEADWTRREDVKWEMEFQWTSRGEAKQPNTFVVLPTVDGIATRIRALTDQLVSLAAPVFEAVSVFTRTVDGIVTEVEAATAAIEATVVALADLRFTPEEAAKRCAAAGETVKEKAAEIVTLIESAPPTTLWNGLEERDVTFGQSLFIDAYTRDVKKAARALELMAAEELESLRALTDMDDLLAAFIARDNTDLRDVSTQFYGDQNSWRVLRQYNGLSSSKLVAGDLVLVPKLTFKDSGA